MIHMRSSVSDPPFIKVTCAALPGELLESELFGHDQRAFAGSARSQSGKVEVANKGTIFLYESPRLQVKFLHVLQDNQYSPWQTPPQCRWCSSASTDYPENFGPYQGYQSSRDGL
jgi:transcriptional regulator with GAF, ATPase, and Fis domain